MSLSQAAELLGRNVETVRRCLRQDRLKAARDGRRVWVRRASLQALLEEKAQWMSWADALAETGLTTAALRRGLREGEIRQRLGAPRWEAGLSRASVQAWAARSRRRRREREAQRAASRPPDDQHKWIRVKDAAVLLGVSRSRVGQLVDAGRVPATKRGSRVWLRLDEVQRVQAARRQPREPRTTGE